MHIYKTAPVGVGLSFSTSVILVCYISVLNFPALPSLVGPSNSRPAFSVASVVATEAKAVVRPSVRVRLVLAVSIDICALYHCVDWVR